MQYQLQYSRLLLLIYHFSLRDFSFCHMLVRLGLREEKWHCFTQGWTSLNPLTSLDLVMFIPLAGHGPWNLTVSPLKSLEHILLILIDFRSYIYRQVDSILILYPLCVCSSVSYKAFTKWLSTVIYVRKRVVESVQGKWC